MYRITIARSAEKDLAHLATSVMNRVTRDIDQLASNPRPSGCKKLKGAKDIWRIRIGDYRVVYAIDDEVKIVAIERIAHRKEVYD